MPRQLQPPGRYGHVDDVDFKVSHEDVLVLWSREPHRGFVKSRKDGFIMPLDKASRVEFVDITHHGTYRGVFVVVKPQLRGNAVTLFSNDARAGDAGMEPSGREEWFAPVAADDPDLTFTTTRTPAPARWQTLDEWENSADG